MSAEQWVAMLTLISFFLSVAVGVINYRTPKLDLSTADRVFLFLIGFLVSGLVFALASLIGLIVGHAAMVLFA